jgi:hypothetical protein
MSFNKIFLKEEPNSIIWQCNLKDIQGTYKVTKLLNYHANPLLFEINLVQGVWPDKDNSFNISMCDFNSKDCYNSRYLSAMYHITQIDKKKRIIEIVL